MNKEIQSNCCNIDWLKSNHQMIHYFGLGFIQLKINDSHRMHFYTPELPPITSDEDVHNHRYDFESLILLGQLEQELFEVFPTFDDHTHVKEEESCQEGSKMDVPVTPCGIKLSSKHVYKARSSYFISHGTFHRVKAEYCLTLIERSDYKKKLAEVVRPVNASKICPFSQKIEVEALWRIVEQMLLRFMALKF